VEMIAERQARHSKIQRGETADGHPG
jgi:hypothetical protein